MSGLAEELSARLELPVEVLDRFANKSCTKKFDPDYLSEIMPEMGCRRSGSEGSRM